MSTNSTTISLASELISGDGRKLTVADVSQLYRNTLNISSPTSAKIHSLSSDSFGVTCHFDTLDCDNQTKVNTFKTYAINIGNRANVGKCIETAKSLTPCGHRTGELCSTMSENGRFLARLVAAPKDGGDTENKQFLEIWDRSRLIKTIDTSKATAHGSINVDPAFSGMQWNPFGHQDKLLYICQPKKPKNFTFFDSDLLSSTDARDQTKSSDLPKVGEEFLNRDNWGECLAEIEHTILAVLDVSNNCTITTLDIEGVSLGNTRWFDKGTKTVSVAYAEETRKLGLIYHNSRPSKILVHDWSQSPPVEVVTLADEKHAYFSPRVTNSGDKIVFLTSQKFAGHFKSSKLNIYNGNTNMVETMDVGLELFTYGLPSNCISSDDKSVLFVRHDHLCQHLSLVDLETSKLSDIKFPTTYVEVLDFKHDLIVSSGSEVNTTPTLFAAILTTPNLVAWHQMEDCLHIEEMEYEAHKIPTPDGQSFVSAFIITPNISLLHKNSSMKIEAPISQNQLPTMIAVHGGPCSAFLLQYKPIHTFYARLGFKVVLINYRGSSGISDDYIKGLYGRVGDLDLNDCLHVIRHFVKSDVIDPRKLIILGGSHGGFLAAHLCCQDEFKFAAAVITNPVIDMSSLHATSDIPDWCYNYGLGRQDYDYKWVPSGDDLAKMFESSPMSRYQQANVPTLMLLGSKDLRVNMYQGMRWYQLLKARGVDAMCKVYPDMHALNLPKVAPDVAITSIIWISSHLKK